MKLIDQAVGRFRLWHLFRKHEYIRVWASLGWTPYCYYGCVTCDKVWPSFGSRDVHDWNLPNQSWRQPDWVHPGPLGLTALLPPKRETRHA